MYIFSKVLYFLLVALLVHRTPLPPIVNVIFIQYRSESNDTAVNSCAAGYNVRQCKTRLRLFLGEAYNKVAIYYDLDCRL